MFWSVQQDKRLKWWRCSVFCVFKVFLWLEGGGRGVGERLEGIMGKKLLVVLLLVGVLFTLVVCEEVRTMW